MKVSQFNKNGVITLGLETPQGLVDVPAEAARRGAQAPKTVLELIQGGEAARRQVEALAEGAACFAQGPAAPAVTGGSRILCIGLNYYRHAKECDMAVPPAPALFNKFANALAADGEAVALPEGYKEFDYEAELVVVMGKAARNVTAEEAPDYIFGYTCGNDLSTRDLQFARSNQWLLSKTFDGFAPLGPCVVTADSIDPADLAISSTVNGETRQDSRTSDLIFSPAQIVADLSRHFTLLPGDLIFTGTPEGVIFGYPAEKQVWLKAGDALTVTIEGIGTLSNTLC